MIYPDELTRWIQIFLGVAVVVINVVVYGLLVARRLRAQKERV